MKVTRLIRLPRKSRCLVILVLVFAFQVASIMISRITHTNNDVLISLDNFDFNVARNFINKWLSPRQILLEDKLDNVLNQIDLRNPEYWKFDNSLSSSALEVTRSQVIGDQKILHYDPRFTLGFLLNHINKVYADHGTDLFAAFPFHWSDWVDLSILNQYILLESKPQCDFLYDPKQIRLQKKKFVMENHCVPDDSNDQLSIGYKVLQQGPKNKLDIKKIEAKSFLYTSYPPPVSVIFIAGDGIYEFPVTENTKLRSSHIFKAFIESSPEKIMFDPVQEYNKLTLTVPSIKYNNDSLDDLLLQSSNLRIELDESDFIYDPEKIVEDLKGKHLTRKQESYFESLQNSLSIESSKLEKHFQEVALIKLPLKSEQGSHYDWRFFNGFVSMSKQNDLDDVLEKKRIILHRLLRTWLQFTYKTNTITWIAHGSLLSWFWDGISFPWDSDIDVQMPISELDLFAQNFNNTLVVEDLNDGFGKFYIDCTSSITHREKGNGNNNIDARFIDVDSGFYIDITGLSLTSTQMSLRYKALINKAEVESLIKTLPPVSKWKNKKTREALELKRRYKLENEISKLYNCRNNHFYQFNELSPLRISLIEGTKTLIPNNFVKVLKLEYTRGMTLTQFNRHVYLPQLRLWIPFEVVYASLKEEIELINSRNARRPSRSKKITQLKIVKLMKEIDIDMIMKLVTSNTDILKEYYLTNEITKLHQVEMSNIETDSMTREFLEDIINTNYKPLRKDMFVYTKQVLNDGKLSNVFQDENELIDDLLNEK